MNLIGKVFGIKYGNIWTTGCFIINGEEVIKRNVSLSVDLLCNGHSPDESRLEIFVFINKCYFPLYLVLFCETELVSFVINSELHINDLDRIVYF